ncbi:hypothetical protein TSUD_106350 [Trifolium subterraneum]|uniref:Uncharacterized protein n=1 Tax=Trifolium subterraneum TaxID=3900 RepID=A0A2Z6LMT7_TRISU|nr:hypothetical protein TSUD_106350 [Trifolium subterraneum]
MSSGVWIRLIGIWKWKGGEAIGTCCGCGTGASIIARCMFGSGGTAGARIGQYVGGGEISEKDGEIGGGAKVVGPPHLQHVPVVGGDCDWEEFGVLWFSWWW